MLDSSIVFLTDAYVCSSFAFALGLALAFGVAVPKAPPCGPPDGGSICGTVDFVVIRVIFGAGACGVSSMGFFSRLRTG